MKAPLALSTEVNSKSSDPAAPRWVLDNLSNLTAQFGRLVHIDLNICVSAFGNRPALIDGSLFQNLPADINFLVAVLGNSPFQARLLVSNPTRYFVAGFWDDGPTFACSGSRLLVKPTRHQEVRLQFAQGVCTVNTQAGSVNLFHYESGKTEEISVQPNKSENAFSPGDLSDSDLGKTIGYHVSLSLSQDGHYRQ